MDWARQLLEIASEGLRRIGHLGESGRDERTFLEPIAEQLARGLSPGQEVLEHWERDWKRSPSRLIEYARY